MLYLHKGEDMNRVEKRNLIHKFNRAKGLKKKNTKGAFGILSEYVRESRKREALRKAKKPKHVETKQVTKDITQPVETKEVKEKGNE